ncbi:prolyl oligopeptidase family protein [imported], putative [Serinicoccus hydrothermalis]|uniref:Prolyl oligopeptidase family protein [imported], putative n=1 Tax=Serinicoccus hydrothermalis TaxID=1758689 RepID=A0A1B1NA65_9MICO|nr:alpha/beta fold hydrolase [Serinicoccus hydrothermalis]ANS78294.1 prolyl oligopeptidase family protein [imported], putative [Serinicoccus hydrothermalis]
MPSPRTAFHDLSHYVALPRVSGLALSPDGTRLVTSAATLNPSGTGYVSALWEVDPTGEREAYRITRSAKGESGAAFGADGDLYFTSSRPDPDDEEDAAEGAALWTIPGHGGEARVLLRRPGGVAAVTAARDADRVLVTAGLLPGASTEAEHAQLAEGRTKAKVDAILHTTYPIRFWDHDLGPERPQVFALDDGPAPGVDAVPEDDPDGQPGAALPGTTDRAREVHLRLLTGDLPAPLHEPSPQVAPDGSFMLVGLTVPQGRADLREGIVRVDLDGGGTRTLFDTAGQEAHAGPVSPDGSRAVVVVSEITSPTTAPHPRMHLMDTATGELTPLAHDWDRWAQPVAWTPDGGSVLVLADSEGRRPVFRVDVATGEVTRVTRDDAAWSDLVLSPDGTTAYGVRSSYLFPPELARVDLASGDVTRLPGPAERPEVPGRLEEVETTAEDGSPVRAWLALPEEAPASSAGHPTLLWVHGGPLGSWNAWTWRWNPWLMTAQGYAVLLPDPALSTGYGQDFVQRGWGAWGQAPYTDLMAITDAALARDDLDAERTAAMGGSFGGYMANWIAGHTDRFRAIVTHASLWALDGFGPTTDAAFYWQREMTEEMGQANSPHRFVEDIVTPMLVIHGDKDYRVPIGEGLRLWYELLSRSGLPQAEDGTTAHRFLFFPHENHWILKPQHAKVWYATVSAFLAEHVLGQEPPPAAEHLGLAPPEAD